ncbi:MAG: recombinase family protein, partial [Myxococcales bacterium]|nr:recombinase family protein [Myxococcales bacterium]
LTMHAQPQSYTVAVAYLRVSTDEQHLGPEAQRAAIEAWADREGVQVAAWHVDHGVSGAAPLDKRPALAAALDDLQAGAVLVVAKRDRLARDTLAAAMLERLAARAGARIVAADGVGNGDGPEDRLMRRMVDAFAEYEREIIRARTRSALAAKARRGERTGGVPVGYRVGADGVSLERDPAEARIVAAVLRARDAGLSLRAISDELTAAGYTTRKGGPISHTQVRRILQREAA